jgi:hypothetical protein
MVSVSEETKVMQKRRIKIIPIFLMHLVLGLGITALGTFAKNKWEQIGGVIFFLLYIFLFVGSRLMFQCYSIGGVYGTGSGCLMQSLANILLLILGLGSYIYLIAKIIMLKKEPDAELVIF